MKFTINKEIFGKFPGLNLGIVVASGIDNAGESREITGLLREKEKEIRENYATDTLSQNPKIDAWRKAYSSFGAKPKKYKCSVENLYRMILNGIDLRHINKIVDLYNYVSIKHMLPLGGDNLDKVDGSIELKFAKGDELFVELNSEEKKNPKAGEVVYADGKEVLCRRWNWRECEKTKMTPETKNVAIVVEGLPPVTETAVKEIIEELAGLVEKYCGGSTEKFILNKEKQEVELEV